MPLVHPAILAGSSGNASSPLLVDGSGNLLVNIAQGSITSSSGALAGSSPNVYVAGTTNALQADLNGYLEVNVKAGSGSGLSVTDEAAFTAASSQFAPDGGVYNDAIAALTSGQTGADRSTPNRGKHVNLRNNSGTEIGTLANAVRIDPIGTTTQPVSLAASVAVTGTFWQTTQPVSGTFWQATQPVSLASTITVTQTPATSGGLSFYSGSINAAATTVKASAGQLYGYDLYNSNASAVYVQVFNKLIGSVTLGTTVADMVIVLPAGGGRNVSYDSGIAMSTGISFACTTTRGGLTSPAATVDVNFFFK
jgi:hypothetical protein